MGQLVADGGGQGAVVGGVIGLLVEEGGLEDAGREAHLVLAGVVVGVVGLWRHVPLVPVHRLAELGHAALEIKDGRGLDIQDIGPAGDLEAAVVAPAVGIAHLAAHGVELLEGLGLGGLDHPVGGQDAGPHGLLVEVDHLEGAVLGGRAEGGLHEELAEVFTQGAIRGGEDALPAGAQFGGARERLPVEGEVLADEGGSQEGRGAPQDMPAQVDLPGPHRLRAEEAAQGLEELGLAHQHMGFPGGKGHGGEIGLPVQGGRGREVLAGQLVVVGLGIPQGHEGAGGLGQLRLQGHDRPGRGTGGLGTVSSQHEDPRHMVFIGLADGLGLLPRAQVVVALGQPETALPEAGDHGAAVLVVDLDAEAEPGVDAQGVEPAQLGHEALGGLHGLDGGEEGRQGGEALLLDEGLVHAGGVEVAHALGNAALGATRPGGGFEDALQDREVALIDLLVHTVGGVLAGNRHLVEGAVGIGVEVLAGGGGRVDVGGIDPEDGPGLRAGGRFRHEGRHQRRDEPCRSKVQRSSFHLAPGGGASRSRGADYQMAGRTFASRFMAWPSAQPNAS